MVAETAAGTAADLELGWAESGLTVRRVRGSKMRSYQGLFDEFAAALQFPPYFGENSNAFDECLTDLSWLPPQSGYVIVVVEPGEVLADAGGVDDLAWLVRSLARAQIEWATPVESGEWWDRPAVPFHVVLQWNADQSAIARDRWVAAGAELAPLAHTLRRGVCNPDRVANPKLNRLALVADVRGETQAGHRVTSRSVRHFLDFRIDGRSLRELVSDPGDTVTPLCREWPTDKVAEAVGALRGVSHSADCGLAKNEVELLVCSECGDIECGAVVASVRVAQRTVTWYGFRWVQDADRHESPIEVEGAPFTFDRRDYEQQLARATAP